MYISKKKEILNPDFFHDFGVFSKNHLSHVSGFCIAGHIYNIYIFIYLFNSFYFFFYLFVFFRI